MEAHEENSSIVCAPALIILKTIGRLNKLLFRSYTMYTTFLLLFGFQIEHHDDVIGPRVLLENHSGVFFKICYIDNVGSLRCRLKLKHSLELRLTFFFIDLINLFL